MHRIGHWVLYIGIVLTVGGLIGGGVMIVSAGYAPAPLIALVPFGFLLTFTGLCMVVLHGPRSSDQAAPPSQQPHDD